MRFLPICSPCLRTAGRPPAGFARYGQRWGRHWLDLVRYAESDGYRQDAFRPDAWRYRDYVVRSFNADKPYDRFLTEQLAGDELDPTTPSCESPPGYLRLGTYEYNQRNVSRAVGRHP